MANYQHLGNDTCYLIENKRPRTLFNYQKYIRGHLQTDFGTLNIIMMLTSAHPLPSPSLLSYYENNALTIEAQNVIVYNQYSFLITSLSLSILKSVLRFPPYIK